MKHLFAGLFILINLNFYAQQSKKPTFNFNDCPSGKYKKCFKKIETPEIFNFQSCSDEKCIVDLFYKQLQNYIASNLDADFKKAIIDNNITKKESPYLTFTFWINNSSKIVPDLVGSNIPRNSPEFKKLQFLLSRIKLTNKMFPYGKPPVNRQMKTHMNFDFASDKNNITYKGFENKEWKYNSKDSLTAPVYKGCHQLENKYNKETFEAEKKCMHHYISKLISEKLDTNLIANLRNKSKNTYGIYNSKCYAHVDFTFSKDGIPIRMQVISIYPEFENEVIKTLNYIPKATYPATKNGKKVNMEFHLPIVFKIYGRPVKN